MAYVAVRGGEEAIEASVERLEYLRLCSGRVVDHRDILAGMGALVDQVMSEASLYAPDLAALAIKQAQGSPEEAVFILRAYRSTIPRIHYTGILSTKEMHVQRRISSAFKDIPGGQILGASSDYAHRLLDFDLIDEDADEVLAWLKEYHENKYGPALVQKVPKVLDYLRREGLVVEQPVDDTPPKDVTKAFLTFPTCRSERLQVLTRGQTGAVTALGYASLRAFGGGALHATVGELRVGMLPVSIPDPALNEECPFEESYYIGEIRLTEVETLIPVKVPKGEGRHDIEFEIGYGICYGQNETKAIAMSLLDHNLETADSDFPTHNEELVLLHIDSVEATGFISHLKLPHYVTFQAKLDAIRKVKRAGKGESEQDG